MASSLPSASVLDNVRFNASVIVPNAVQGLFTKKPGPVKLATSLNADKEGYRLCAALRDRHGGEPVWVRIVKDPALLLLDVEDVRVVLEGAPAPFAADPPAKRQGMAHFQPDALTISRGEAWRERRAFADAVLADAPPVSFAWPSDALSFDAFHAELQRFTRGYVLGAADDERVTSLLGTLMEQANSRPSQRSEEYAEFERRVSAHVAEAADGSLAGVAAGVAVSDEVRVPGQFTHWLFAMGDTLAINVWRALGLVAAYGSADLAGTLKEAMRLWPTTPMLSRETTGPVVLRGIELPAETQVLIVNTFFHRDPERLGDAAHRFTPDGWLDGGAFTDDWGLNFFSHGPQACPGAALSLRIGVAAMEAVLGRGGVVFDGRPAFDAAADLPHMLDPFSLQLARSG